MPIDIPVPDVLGNYVRGMALGQQRQKQSADSADEMAMRSLVPQAFGGDQAALASLSKYDPKLALGLGQYQQVEAAKQAKAQADQMDQLRGQAANVIDTLSTIKDPAQYGNAIDMLSKDPRVSEVAGQLGIDINALRDPSQLTAVRARLMVAPEKSAGQASKAADIQEFEAAKASGFGGTYLDFVRAKARAGQLPPQTAPQSFRTMTPDEVSRAGLPAGTVAQTDGHGKIDIVSKPPIANLAPKDVNTARTKLTMLTLAKQQLANAQKNFDALKNSASAGPGQGWTPTQAGQKFDRSIDTLRGTFQSLTRVPGVGSMSDYESKLDAGKMPSRSDYEEVTQQQLDSLSSLVSTLETGYKDMLTAPDNGPGVAGPKAGEVVDGYTFLGGDPANKASWRRN